MSALIIALLMTATGADAFADNFERGVTAYQAEDFSGAIDAFEQLVASSVDDPVVFYNLGNAHYRAGNMGHAIANYERALRSEPGLQSARDNLTLAQSAARRNLAPPLGPAWRQAILFWDDGLAYPAVRLVGLVAWTLVWLLLAIRLWRPVPYLRTVAVALLAVALLCGLSAWTKANRTPLAVTVEATVPVRFGPSEDEVVRFELYEGDHVAVDLRRDGWARVTTIDGERGWMPGGALAFVDPPYTGRSSAAE